eukprot:6472227-Amphidinium_carterae.1
MSPCDATHGCSADSTTRGTEEVVAVCARPPNPLLLEGHREWKVVSGHRTAQLQQLHQALWSCMPQQSLNSSNNNDKDDNDKDNNNFLSVFCSNVFEPTGWVFNESLNLPANEEPLNRSFFASRVTTR